MMAVVPRPDALAAVRDALLLLRTGRSTMALRMLETLPNLIERDLREQSSGAYLRGRSEGEMAAARRFQTREVRRPAPKASRLDRLRALLSDPTGRAKVREALRLDDRLLNRVVDGTLTLSPQQWRRLRDLLP